ncbi:adenosylcobinamide-phosphate synthase CbiB [Parasphingopyxis sp.]|uniref:adenosylcobinamide-phosphate synthase CbiB n=1 Tax=Parasphingopyxis sp. TaxID=1920299 RepID=UPI00261CB08D|nr:adenosylcobinamide-phosphate synthase CbiB [Parasphingopyxis sp.]
MMALWIMLAALALEVFFTWPDALDRRIGHPVRWFGWLVSQAEQLTNHDQFPRYARIALGAVAALVLVALAGTIGVALARLLPDGIAGFALAVLVAWSLIAARSLHEHVSAVCTGFANEGLEAARNALGDIVGRETASLDEAGVARAAIESLAENASDGVTAPLFWGALLGLPGLFAYKAINTLDSMIGHKNERYEAFGKAAAMLDDIANLIPARLTGLLFALCARSSHAFWTMARDAGKHRSPNAGWPEAAMAGALNVRLSGPRCYGDGMTGDPWLNEGARDPAMTDLASGLSLYRRVVFMIALLLAIAGLTLFL